MTSAEMLIVSGYNDGRGRLGGVIICQLNRYRLIEVSGGPRLYLGLPDALRVRYGDNTQKVRSAKRETRKFQTNFHAPIYGRARGTA